MNSIAKLLSKDREALFRNTAQKISMKAGALSEYTQLELIDYEKTTWEKAMMKK